MKISLKKSMTAAIAVMACTSIAACSGTSGGDRTSSFPESEFPSDMFSNLSGQVAFYDTSGGVVADARQTTIFADFTQLTGVPVTQDYNDGNAKLVASLQSGGAPVWNATAIGSAVDLKTLEGRGYLERLDPKIVPFDKIQDDWNISEFAVPFEAFAAVLTYNTDQFQENGQHPENWVDLFDTAKFPGKRCMFKGPEGAATLEAALLADGVPADQLYPLDVDRALKKLATVKDDIVWWTSGAQAVQLMTSGECSVGINWISRVYDGSVHQNLPLANSWNQPLSMMAFVGVPKGAQNKDVAQALISLWLRDKQGQVDYTGKVAQTTPLKTTTLQDYPEKVRKWLPTGDNMRTAVIEDANYWASNLAAVTEKFNAFVA